MCLCHLHCQSFSLISKVINKCCFSLKCLSTLNPHVNCVHCLGQIKNNLSFSMVFKILQAFYVTNYEFIVNTAIYKRKWAPHHGTLSIFMLNCALSQANEYSVSVFVWWRLTFPRIKLLTSNNVFSQAPMQTALY